MRLLIYNIAYGTGGPTSLPHQLVSFHRYLKTPRGHLDHIIQFIDDSHADIVGLVEIDTGSPRTGRLNQVETVANHLRHYHHSATKYGAGSLTRRLPYLKHQANAVLTKAPLTKQNIHFFPIGFKKLIIEVETNGLHFFLVHLALHKRVRRKQLQHLTSLIERRPRVIVAGDFNTLTGAHELEQFCTELSLTNANHEEIPTFPSWAPRKQLDFILCSKDITIEQLQVPDIRHSDHLPLILDFLL